MIDIRMWGEDYEQDIRPLVKAFYPDEELQVTHGSGEDGNSLKEWERTMHEDAEDGKLCREQGQTIPEEASVPSCAGRLLLWLSPERYQVVFAAEEGRKRTETEEFRKLPQGVYQNEGLPDRRMYRNALHRSLYRIFSEATGHGLPWGTLTGIRPTRLVLDRLAAGETRESIEAYFKTEYLCSEKKARTCIRIAERERELLAGISEDSYSLYIGIPFCPSICLYCSFSSYPLSRYRDYVEPYLESLFREIEFAAGCFRNRQLVSIYIGGGTPTTLTHEQLRRLLCKVRDCFDLSGLREWTVEAGRPDSITREKLAVLKEEGVTRISINPQTMQQRTLDFIGRRHTVEQVTEAFCLARECGHENINMDLIIGLAGEGEADVRSTLEQLDGLAPDSLTVHTLAIKRAARLTTEREKYQERRSAETVAMSLACEDYMERHGYEPYYMYRQKNMAENLENIGYSRPGKECLYNILMMEEYHTILALGANASSKFVFPGTGRLERVENVKSVRDYVLRTEEMIGRKRDFLEKNGEFL